MKKQCPRCLSSFFPHVGHGCEFCKDHDVHQTRSGVNHTSNVRIGASEKGREPKTYIRYLGQQKLKLQTTEQS